MAKWSNSKLCIPAVIGGRRGRWWHRQSPRIADLGGWGIWIPFEMNLRENFSPLCKPRRSTKLEWMNESVIGSLHKCTKKQIFTFVLFSPVFFQKCNFSHIFTHLQVQWEVSLQLSSSCHHRHLERKGCRGRGRWGTRRKIGRAQRGGPSKAASKLSETWWGHNMILSAPFTNKLWESTRSFSLANLCLPPPVAAPTWGPGVRRGSQSARWRRE